MKSKFILALAAGIIGLTASANAAFVNAYATWSGGSFGNSASAYATFKLDTDYLGSNPGFNSSFDSQFITDIDMTVTGAASGNGHFTSSDFAYVYFLNFFGPVDFSQELVGQSNFMAIDFINFNYETGIQSAAPFATGPSQLTVQQADGTLGEPMQLTSLTTSAVPEASTSLGLLGPAAGGILTRRRQKRAA